jgi:hypothetical protein
VPQLGEQGRSWLAELGLVVDHHGVR